MEDTNYSYNLYDNRKPCDFLIRSKNFNDIDFENFFLTENNIFNFLYEELYLKNNDNSLVAIINKLDYYPSTLSLHLKKLVKNNYIELVLVKDSQPKKILVKFTKHGLEQIEVIREIFLQCKNCKECC